MGYKPAGKTYNLVFDELPGLEVLCKGATLGELDRVRKLDPNMNEPDPEKRLAIFRFFEKRVITWNIDHPVVIEANENGLCSLCGLKEDDPLPPTVTAMQCLEISFIMQIIIGWVFAVARVPVPKEMSTNGGGMNGLGSPLPDGLVDQITRELANLQSPMRLQEPNFTSGYLSDSITPT